MNFRVWREFSEHPYQHFCLVNKDTKNIVIGEGSVLPFTTKKVKLEEFLIEHVVHFTPENQIDIEKYVNT